MSQAELRPEYSTSTPPSLDGGAKDGEMKLPANVKVGLLFLTHELYSKEEVATTSVQMKQFLKSTFSPGKRNILLHEDASSDENARNFAERDREGFARFKSFRAARLYAIIAGAGHAIPEGYDFDSFVHEQEQRILSNPEKDPTEAYRWVMLKTMDELNQEGYAINIVYETGLDDLEEKQRVMHMRYDEYKAFQTRFAARQNQRDQQTVEQITGLVEEAEKQDGDTNIASIFGNNHQVIVDALPVRIQAVTTFIAQPIEDIPEYQIEMLLRAGQEVPEELWIEGYYGKKGGIRKKIHLAAVKYSK